MMKITRITTQKKNKQRYNIFITEGDQERYGFSVDEAILIKHHLRKGLDLDQSFIEQLEKEDAYYQSYALAIRYLSYRMRTKKEMSDYLIEKEIDKYYISGIIDRLVEERLLDDGEFAEAFVRTRINTSSKGPQMVKRELMEKGVSSFHAEKAIQQYSYEIQYERASKWVEKRLRSSKKESFQKQRQKIQATLMQKGFSKDVITDVLSDIQNEKNEDEEWEALVHHGEKLLRRHSRKFEGFQLKQKVTEGLYRQGFSFDKINEFLEEQLNEN